jgi:hypothetical protein
MVYRDNRGSYDGNWRAGKADGNGVRVFMNGNKYVGTFSMGEMHGGGIMQYANGS